MRVAGGILSIVSGYILATMLVASSRDYDIALLDGGLTYAQHLTQVAPWTGLVFGFLVTGVAGVWMMTRERKDED